MTAPDPWYARGLRFHCQRCGGCCRGQEGYVWVTPDEIARIAEFRKETPEAFQREHVRWVEGRLSLLEKPGGDCEHFVKGAGCSVYSVRPPQCRTWPFWPVNVATPAAWKQTGTKCPGVGAGDRVSAECIESHLRQSDGLHLS
jgi:Fe-S-cluster containining protein